MSSRKNAWVGLCIGLALAVGLMPAANAAYQPTVAAKDVQGVEFSHRGAPAESTVLSNELYHKDLAPTITVPSNQATTIQGDLITLADYGAGLEVWRFRTLAILNQDVPGACSPGSSNAGAACGGIAGGGNDAACDGPTVCTRTGIPCTDGSECTDPNEYCDSCVEVDRNMWRVSWYGSYDDTLSPVHSGLLAQNEYDLQGVWPANAPGFGYWQNLDTDPGVLVLPQAQVFYVAEWKHVPVAGSFDDPGNWMLGGFNMRSAPAERGADADFTYIDQDGDGILTSVDRLDPFANAGCSGGVCRLGIRLFISGPPNPNVVDAGAELYSITSNGDSYVDLSLFDGFFDISDLGDDCSGGTSSSAFAGRVDLEGSQVLNNVADVPPIHVVLDRPAGVLFPAPAAFNVVGLQAAGLAPIQVDRGGTPEAWDVFVCRSSSGPSGGFHAASSATCSGEDGPITTTLNLTPKLVFVRQSDGCQVTYEDGIAVPMTSNAYRYNPVPTNDTITLGPGIQFDRDCDGVPDAPGVGGSVPFYPGQRLARCPGDTSCENDPPVIARIFRLTGPGWGFGFTPAVFTDDTDADGILDGADDCVDVADPAQVDSDGDGVGDACDNAPAACNPDQADADGDGIGDVADVCPNDPGNDVDGDGICGDVDNCPTVANADQADGDGDGAGDVCDPCPADPLNDVDGDGVCGNLDNCPDIPNSDQANADGDQFGDVCDPCPLDPMNDVDGDGFCGNVDNCPNDYNPDQADADGDGYGDVCDLGPTDTDGDGIPDPVDACPNSILDPTVVVPPTVPGGPVPPGTVLPCDSGVPNVLIPPSSAFPGAGCTISDKIAACDANSRNKGQFEKCVKSLTKQLKKAGIITEKQRKAIDKCAKKYKKRDVHASGGISTGGASDL